MTKLKIISKLWSCIYDLKMFINNTGTKTMEEIDADLKEIESYCCDYTDMDDMEI
ncbi:hypothetical protein NDGK_02512 [Clostridiales bacterium CHKCI001]|nr:hypothetical protein NDGK_02512 [Clostridiales bacterium CHKCI001]